MKLRIILRILQLVLAQNVYQNKISIIKRKLIFFGENYFFFKVMTQIVNFCRQIMSKSLVQLIIYRFMHTRDRKYFLNNEVQFKK